MWPIRAGFVVLGLGALSWSLAVLPAFLREAPIIAASERLVAGDQYSDATIDDLKSRADLAEREPQSPKMLGAVSILRQWVLERATLRGEAKLAAPESTKRAIVRALSVAPSDAYQWLSLYWASRTDGSFDASYLAYLQMSYATGPYEAWVALRRNPLALKIYPLLTPNLQLAVLDEFAGLVRSRLYGQAAAIAASVTPNTRKVIAARIASLDLADRESFAKAATEQGITDMVVPGVDIGPMRPWRR